MASSLESNNIPENTAAGETISSSTKLPTKKNRNRNRNRNRNKSKGKEGDKSENSTHIDQKSSDDTISNDKANKKNAKKSKPSSKNNQQNTQRTKPIVKELEKLLPVINPITINGIPVKTLTFDPLTFLKKVIDDKSNQDELFMTFLMKPSDSDFPFDLDFLTVTLCIPQSYPNKPPYPTIMVLNDDIPRGYSLNIEIGFKKIVSAVLENRQNKQRNNNKGKNRSDNTQADNLFNRNTKTDGEINDEEEDLKIDVIGGNDLLGMIKTLDKYLEKFLSMEKKDTIKLVKIINKQQQKQPLEQTGKESSQKEKKNQESKNKKEVNSSLNMEKYKKRTEELAIFRQRLNNNSLTVASDNSHGTTYKLVLYFKDDDLTLEFDDAEEVTIEKLFVKIIVPKEYLNNPKKAIKLSVDMSNNYNIGLINSIADTSVRLIFGKLINNISRNFDIFALDIASKNCKDSKKDINTYWTITSQINFFVQNIQKFMNEKVEFQHWYEANQLLNDDLQQQQQKQQPVQAAV